MNYNFTDRTRMVLGLAREEAIRLQHDYVGTEHILLAVVREGEGAAVAALMRLQVDFNQLRQLTEDAAKKGKSTLALGELLYSSTAKKVIDYAMQEADRMRHSYVGTEHILLGLVSDNKTISAQVLTALGVSLENARAEVLTLLGADHSAQRASSKPARPSPAPGTQRLLRQLEQTYNGPSWHGPTLRELLVDVTPEQAARRGLASAHSIWEIVLHSAAWKRVVATRLDGKKASLQGEEDWPTVQDTSAESWQAALADLDAANEAVIQRVAELADTDLNLSVPGQKVSIYATVHGVLQHDIYHAGQIALLKKTVQR
ncbi:MAG: Clp protease N-terminal domain-containing protein [Longimicrobiales bacterium]